LTHHKSQGLYSKKTRLAWWVFIFFQRKQMSENINALAERQYQDSLDTKAVAKAFPDAIRTEFRGNEVYVSDTVNTNHFRDIELFVGNNPSLGKSMINARLWHSVKRPGRPVIKVYSYAIYGLTLEHLLNIVNDMPPKSVMNKIGHLLKIQEKTLVRLLGRPKRAG